CGSGFDFCAKSFRHQSQPTGIHAGAGFSGRLTRFSRQRLCFGNRIKERNQLIMRILNHDDVLAALTGGSIYACGGGGFYEHGLAMGHAAITINKVKLVSLDELNDDDIVITAAAIGAPGGTTDWEMTGRDYIKAAQLLIDHY